MAKSNFIVRGGADFSGIKKEMAKTQKTMTSFQSSIASGMKVVKLALAGLAIGKYLKDSINAASQLEGAMLGLRSILEGQGRSFSSAQKFINDYIKDGLVPLSDAVTAYKNLSARGYNDDQIQQVMTSLKDAAAFGRQASYTLGAAVSSATEGLKNENSVLVDNAGVTKNVAKMWDEYAKSIGKNAQQLTQQEKIQAEVNGIIKETRFQVGDAAKYTDTFAGRLASLNKTLYDIKVNIGNAFMPIVNTVLPILQALATKLAQVTAYIAQFSQAMFGKSNLGNQTKAISGQAAAVEELGEATAEAGKKAKGAVAGFDELNVLGQSEDSGAAGLNVGDIASNNLDIEPIEPEIDTSQFDGFRIALDGVRESVSQLGTYLKDSLGPPLQQAIQNTMPYIEAWKTELRSVFESLMSMGEPLKGWFTGDLIPFWQTHIINMGEVLSGLLDTGLKVFQSFQTALLPIITWFVEEGLSLFISLYDGASEIFMELWKATKHIFDTIWKDAIDPAMQLMSRIILDALNIIKGFWDKWGRDIIDGLKLAIKKLADLFDSIWEIVQPIIAYLLETLSYLWENHFKGVIEGLMDFIGKLVTGALEIFNEFIMPIVTWFVDTFGPGIAEAIKFAIGDLAKFLAYLADLAKDVIRIMGGILDFIVGVFTGNWEKAWNGISDIVGGIVNIIKGLINGLISAIEKGLNFVVKMINKFIDGVNDTIIKLNIVPGINIPTVPNLKEISVPRLARGGIVDSPTLAMIGEQGKEAVMPLENNTGWIADLASQIVGIMGNSQGSGDTTIIVKIGEDTILDKVISGANRQSRINGKTVFQL